ncbi:MAG: hydroxymethylglutaryl-CoA lyase [Ilumatobacteraceae bacterium]|nr:hydroxymethylglutaryl-CoA lyase [Ilumatobacteraceae bacterium]
MPESVQIREVGARDGLQSEAPIAIEQRVALIESLLAAGVTRVEMVAFVSPKAVPSMAGAAEVVAAIGQRPGVVRAALVPNLRGAQMAIDAGVDELTVIMSASAVYNERNVHMTLDESIAQIAGICATEGVPPVDAVVSCSFGSPYEGDVDPAFVASLCARLRDAGAGAVTLADTTGMATPRRIAEVLTETGNDVGLHLHETRGTGVLNAYAGLQRGVTRFDCSVGGLGGSPFAAGAAGNVATEELVALLDDLGISTGIDVEALISSALLIEQLVGHPVPSRVAHVGTRSRRPVAG